VNVAFNVASEELALAILPRKSTTNRGEFDRIMAEHERLVLGVAWRMRRAARRSSISRTSSNWWKKSVRMPVLFDGGEPEIQMLNLN
jgi:hypothetical protein